MAPLFHPIAAHFTRQPVTSEPVDILLEISLATCLAGLQEKSLDQEEVLDSMLDELLH